jgi:deoxyribodipyrimidine photo-lyase
VVFTRDLRVHDNPALVSATAHSEFVLPLFVLDDELLRSAVAAPPQRLVFLAGSLADLDSSLRARGGGLVVRRGAWTREVIRAALSAAATDIFIAEDVTPFAQRRFRSLQSDADAAGIAVHREVGLTVVPPGELVPSGRESYAVFTPYWRAWESHPWRRVLPAPDRVSLPPEFAEEIAGGRSPLVAEIAPVASGAAGAGLTAMAASATGSAVAGEGAGRARVTDWRAVGLHDYEAQHDDLAAAATSGLSVYLHFGCLSPLELATHLRGRPGGGPFARQLAWRDFFHQIVAPQPDVVWRNYRSEPDLRWAPDPARVEEFWTAWVQGRTGYPLVDAAMRQLNAEGFVHNRARLVAASFLTKDLGLPWWDGARHYLRHLIDGDVVVNNMNWQWVAGTGTDTNRHRVFNPVRQAERFDADALYIRRYLPELADLPALQARNPDAETRGRVGYPPPIVEPASSRRH